MVNVGIIGV